MDANRFVNQFRQYQKQLEDAIPDSCHCTNTYRNMVQHPSDFESGFEQELIIASKKLLNIFSKPDSELIFYSDWEQERTSRDIEQLFQTVKKCVQNIEWK